MFINIERQHESGVSRCKKLKILRKDDTNYLNKYQYLNAFCSRTVLTNYFTR